METYKTNWLAVFLTFFICLIIRLLPIRPPNVEPILASQMPVARAYGGILAFAFAFTSIIFYDLVTGTVGLWSLFTSFAYGILGIFGALYFKTRTESVWGYVKFAIFGTLFFDAATGLTVGPIFFNQSFYGALIGQIPFTLLHLLGNVSFAVTLSPALYRFIINNPKLEYAKIFRPQAN